MKVFTVGIDEKPPIKDNAASSDGITMTTTPIITLGKNRTSYKNYVMYMGTLFFILLFAIIISKLVLYRIPSDLGRPWLELKHRMRTGCDDCMTARIIQSFYPQRSLRIFESSNHAAPSLVLAMQTGQPQAIEQVTSITSTSRSSEARSSIDLPQPLDFHLDFLRKIIPKIKEQAEKSGIEGVMQVKVLQMDSFEPKKLNKLDKNQLRPAINAPQPIELMAPSHSTLLADLLRWNMDHYDQKNGRNFPNLENQIPESQFFESQQNDMVKSEPMLILEPFLQAQELRPLPAAWDNNNSIAWSNSLHLLDLAQQIGKQQWNNFWQSSNPAYNKNNDEKVALWQNIQWLNNQQYLATPTAQQMRPNPSIPWESNAYWQDNVQIGANWQNGIQNQWAENGWQGYQYPQTDMNQNQYQNNNDWNTQKANILDNLDRRMSQAVLSNDNYNNHIYNNNVNDHWMGYHNQWHINNQRSQQQPIASTAVVQSLEVIGPGLPYQAQNQSSRQQEQEQQKQQRQILESLQSQTILEHQIKPLSAQQKQQSQIERQFPNQPIQQEISTVPNDVFQQSVNIPISRIGLDDGASRTIVPLHFNNDDWNWQRTENSNLLVGAINDNQEQLQLLHRERPELPIYPIENGLTGSSNGVKIIDSGLNRVTITEKSEPINDVSSGLSNPILFQVDEPLPQFSSMDESFVK